jgi:hypothetical protein
VPVGTEVGTVPATDGDGDPLAFALTAGDPAGAFAVDSDGLVTVAAPLDYETAPSYTLSVEVSDGFDADTATVTINVDEVNIPPVIDDAEFSVAEDVAVGTEVGTVPATDDDGDPLDFAITGGDPVGAFDIDSDGLVTVAAPLDYETAPSYTLSVEVSDGWDSDTATVTVAVTDVFEVPATSSFRDVPLGNLFFVDIEWLAFEGITRGCNPPTNALFCPDDGVTRGQMAAFLHRALDGVLIPGPDPGFTDIDKSVFATDILWLGAVGVTRGCNPPLNDRYCPMEPVTRAQMAAFLVRALGYSDDGGGDLFVDDDGSLFESAIDKLATAGVTKGCNPPDNDRFCPNDPVTRGQMAAFLHRALGAS